VAQLVEELSYNPEGRRFDSQLCQRDISLTSFRPHYATGIYSASKINEYRDYFLRGKGSRCVGLTTLPPSCAECHEIWELQPPGTLRASPGLYRDNIIFTIVNVWGWVTGQTFYDWNLFIYYAIFCNAKFLKNATTAF